MMGAQTSAIKPRLLAPFALSGPATLFFIGLVLLPLLLTIILSFNTYDYTAGIQSDFTFANYLTVLQDDQFVPVL